jgi:hypothetical protein
VEKFTAQLSRGNPDLYPRPREPEHQQTNKIHNHHLEAEEQRTRTTANQQDSKSSSRSRGAENQKNSKQTRFPVII